VATFGAHEELQLLLLLITALGLLLLADPLHVPYPILLVVGGLALGFAPGVPTVTLPPDAVIVGILPPLLYSASFNTGLRDLKRNIRPISRISLRTSERKANRWSRTWLSAATATTSCELKTIIENEIGIFASCS
jgi:hypothetical protein